ncbi:MAG: hypothetical protein LC689_09270 [Myxococcales bacterium]|nr:hypothetical protein [Myxococcales bacterium]
MTSLVLSLLIGAANVVKPAPAAPANEVEVLVKAAAQLEKLDGCEAAYAKYQEAGGKLVTMKDRARSAQLTGVVTNKLDKLQACWSACQPNEKQRELFATAKEAADSEPHRAGRILKQLLVGRSTDRCVFWSDARALLRTLPGQAEALDRDDADPCAVSPDLQKAIADSREAVKKERSVVADLNYDRAKLPWRVGELADVYRAMDQTRMLLLDLRESFLECDKIEKGLAADSTALKESLGLAQDLVLGTYKDQLAAMGRKVRNAQAQLAQKDELLTSQIGEQEKLKKQLEGLSGLSEELYDDLFALTQAESVSFSVDVEGRRIEQPLEDVRALIQSEKKVLETLAARYPEFFKDGVNAEGLKRKKLVLEKLAQMMKRYGSRSDQRLGYSRTMSELDATMAMIDKAIGVMPAKPDKLAAVEPEKDSSSGSGPLPWFVGGGSVLAIAGLTILRIRAASKS